MRLTILLALSAVPLFASPAYSTETKCNDKKEFTLGTEGGSFTYAHIRVDAAKGDLTKSTRFVAEVCPGAELESEITKETKVKGQNGEEKILMKTLAHEQFPSISLEAPDGLEIKEGASLQYCLLGTEKHPADAVQVFHESHAAPISFGKAPTAKENCVRFNSLSKFHHMLPPQTQHLFGVHIPNPVSVVSGLAHDAAAAGKALEHESSKLGHTVVKVGKAGFNFMKGLLHPCKACQTAMYQGIQHFVCGKAGSAARAEVESCSEDVAEVEPEIAEYSPALCSGLELAVSEACKKIGDNTPGLKKAYGSIAYHACTAAHLC